MKFKEFLNELKDVGTYISASFTEESNKQLSDYAESIGLKPMNSSEFHVTIVYSPTSIDVKHGMHKLDGTAEVTGIKYLGDEDSEYRAIVLEIESKAILDRHNHYIEEHNYKHSYDSFIQHVSLQYKPEEGINLNEIELPKFKLQLESETITDLKS